MIGMPGILFVALIIAIGRWLFHGVTQPFRSRRSYRHLDRYFEAIGEQCRGRIFAELVFERNEWIQGIFTTYINGRKVWVPRCRTGDRQEIECLASFYEGILKEDRRLTAEGQRILEGFASALRLYARLI